eukprot:11762937-Alexandrium_andersonii.AAC.1
MAEGSPCAAPSWCMCCGAELHMRPGPAACVRVRRPGGACQFSADHECLAPNVGQRWQRFAA